MIENQPATFSVRQGSPADLAVVTEICQGIHGGHDYIPYMWEKWTADPRNMGFIVELNGQPAGVFFLRLEIAGLNVGWLQGVRVAASFRKQGVARFILEQFIQKSRELGLEVARYTTAQDNLPMHRLAGLYGFWQVSNFLNYNFATNTEPPRGNVLTSRLVTTSEFDEAYRLILESAEHQQGHGIYCNVWNWKLLDMDTFRLHLERREVYCLTGALKVLAIMARPESDSYWISFLAGEPTFKLTLLQELVRKVTKSMLPDQPLEFTAQLIQTPANKALLVETGFAPDKLEPVMVLYELKLHPTASTGE